MNAKAKPFIRFSFIIHRSSFIVAEVKMARDRGEVRVENLVDRVVKIRRCAAVVKGGRRFSFNALVVVGDRNGRVSWGYGKANEVPPAVEKAAKDGQERLKRQKQVQMAGETIPHRVIGQYGASKVILVPAGPGTGVKAGPGVRDVLECCGIHNILTKTHGSTNPINLVKATIQGLMQLRTREEVARLRGVTL
jgi:small subunit ribosomal protein S5